MSYEKIVVSEPFHARTRISRTFPTNRLTGLFRLRTAAYLLFVADFVIVFASGLLAKFIYLDILMGFEQPNLYYFIFSFLLALQLNICFELIGLYKTDNVTETFKGFGKLWGGLIISFLVLIGILYMLKISDVFSRGWILLWFAICAPALVLARWKAIGFLRARLDAGQLRHAVAVYGSPAFIERFNEEYQHWDPLGSVEGIYVTPDRGSERMAANGYLSDLRLAMSKRQYDTVVIALPAENTEAIQLAVKSLASYSAELLLCSELDRFPCSVKGSRILGNLRFDIINVMPGSEYSRVAKPVLDYALAFLGTAALAPLLAIIAVAIKLDSPGPVFFRQRRYGQNNKIFRIFKFRTMTVAEDGPTVVQATRNDARVTRVGRFLRSSSLDELPQLFNVLRGEMSIVGPRPHAIAHDDAFEEKLDLFSRRRRVRPGITGWAQVNGFRGETRTIEDIRARMQHDLHYIDSWSIWLDLEIIARTVLVAGKRAY